MPLSSHVRKKAIKYTIMPRVSPIMCVGLLYPSCLSDEDDALYERVSGEQWRVECLVQLLAEMDSDLPGDFFQELLQVATVPHTERQPMALAISLVLPRWCWSVTMDALFPARHRLAGLRRKMSRKWTHQP